MQASWIVMAAFVALNALAAPAQAAPAGPAAKTARAPIAWRDWSERVFTDAKAQKKYVLLDLGAVWCHWCHVMDATTYRDPRVVALIRKHFIPVRVDQDTRPDLSRRYESFGWPATIVFDAEGNDIGKMRGYRETERFLHTLQAILDDPSPLRIEADEDGSRRYADAPLADALRTELDRNLRKALDTAQGGLLGNHRFLLRDALDWGLAHAARGDAAVEAWTRLTLRQARALIDPAWGGMYQYSTHGDWAHPHYEKIMETQAAAMSVYSRAWLQWREPGMLDAAQAVRRYVRDFLTSPEGAFYTSQDADRVPGEQGDGYFALPDAERRKLGIPRVDTHVYARENGWMIESLVDLYSASGDPAVLDEALRAARWILAQRGQADGSFRRDARDAGGPYLGDQIAMGRAMLALYSATGERDWLARARKSARQLGRFAAPGGGGYLSAPHRPTAKLKDRPHLDENIEAARFANRLWRTTGEPADHAAAQVALRFLSAPAVAQRRLITSGLQLAADEAASEPLHVTVVGARSDPKALALQRAALALPGSYRRIEWWDPAEGPLANPDVKYPQVGRPAAFVCADRSCSLPLFEPPDLARYLAGGAASAPR